MGKFTKMFKTIQFKEHKNKNFKGEKDNTRKVYTLTDASKDCIGSKIIILENKLKEIECEMNRKNEIINRKNNKTNN